KNLAYFKLLECLDELINQLEATAKGNPLYLTDLGLHIRRTGSRKRMVEPGVPKLLRVQPGRLSGEAMIVIAPVVGARMYAIEWRSAEQPDWHNGNYSTSRRQYIQVPGRQEISVRVCALGAGNRHGAWSEPALAFIP
ncbi:MAG: hypothetical protein JNK89_09035, partial [Saprospiraceae bacterium]|nr:hypothetical protein [Saprospiraceae bacterium]